MGNELGALIRSDGSCSLFLLPSVPRLWLEKVNYRNVAVWSSLWQAGQVDREVGRSEEKQLQLLLFSLQEIVG